MWLETRQPRAKSSTSVLTHKNRKQRKSVDSEVLLVDSNLLNFLNRITETDNNSIPTGGFVKVGGTPYDLRVAQRLGDVMIKGNNLYDDNFCVSIHGNKVSLDLIGN